MVRACARQIAAYRGPQQRPGIGAIQYRVRGAVLLECSPPARRRRAAGEVDGTNESLLSEGASAEVAWPRSQTAAAGV